jgi:uncharacterized membrane protein HdeD (DUF308 family)
MPSHEDKFISKLLIGFGAIIGGIMAILYACFERTKQDDWYFWGVVSSLLICFGIYSVLGAFVHKVKSDLIRKQRSLQQQKANIRESRIGTTE